MMYKYNPRKKSHEQLKNSLVGIDRWDILKSIQEELTLKKGEKPKQHWMIVGPRGMGKSHLLTLLYYKVKSDPKLNNRWIPILFPEELRMANNLPKFLERAVQEIILEIKDENEQVADELNSKIIKIREIPASERTEYLFSLLKWIQQVTGKFCLFITENLQNLLGKKISEIEQKKLRAYLQSNDVILFIGSATTVFEALHDHSYPFYHFFHIKRLKDMNFEEMKKLIITILSDSNKAEVINKVIENEARLKAIHSFAGGNPRMAYFLADIIKTEVPDEMLSLMDTILDELTLYFDSILGDIPDHQEEILNTLAIYEPAQSPKEIAEHLEVPQNTIRNYLKQMKESGYVRIAFSKGKSNYYCLNEYLYRIWFQMRDSSHREETRWLMELLLMLYSPSSLVDEKNKIDECTTDDDISPYYKKLIVEATQFISRNPEYCKIIEWCVESATKDMKKQKISKSENASLQESVKFALNNQIDKAIVIIKKVIKTNPKSYIAYTTWASCLVEQKQFDEAIVKLKKGLEINPKSAIAYMLWGECLRVLKLNSEAIEKYKKVIELKPNDENAYASMGFCLRNEERYDEAIDCFKKVIDLAPQFCEVYGAWGDCLRYLGRYSEADAKYQKSLEINPSYTDAYAAWGTSLRLQKREYEAIEKYKSILKIEPNSARTYSLWAECLADLKKYTEASRKIKKSIDIDPNLAVNYILWGNYLRKQKKYNEAIDKYKIALNINPNVEDAYRLWGICLHKQKKYDEAIKIFRKALIVDPKSEAAYGLWGNSLREMKKYDQAIEKYKKALEINPTSEYTHKEWAYTLAAAKRYDEAIEILGKFINDTSNCSIIYFYGVCLMELERPNEAIKQFQRLINLHYDCSSVYLANGQALGKIDKKEEALLSYLKFIKFQPGKPLMPFIFQKTYKEHIMPIVEKLKSEKYTKQFYSSSRNRKVSSPQLATFLIMLDKYDIVSELFQSIFDEYKGKDKEEKQEFDLLIFTIKFSLWLKVCENNIYEALRLVDLYTEYIRLLDTKEEKEEEISNLCLGLFKLQVHMNIESENTREILKKLKDTKGVPFNEVLMKVWTCLSKSDSVEAQRYLNDKVIAEVLRKIKRKDVKQVSICNY